MYARHARYGNFARVSRDDGTRHTEHAAYIYMNACITEYGSIIAS